MKLLFDQNISNRILNKLREHFPDIKHVKELGLNDRNDFDIWQFAKKENYAIVTFDSDFYDIVLINGIPPKIIWLRTGNLKTNELTEILIMNKERILFFINNHENYDIGCLEIQ